MSKGKDRELVVQPEHEVEVGGGAAFEVHYIRAVPGETPSGAELSIADVVSGELDGHLRGKVVLESAVADRALELLVLGGNGAPRVRREVPAAGESAIAVKLSKVEVAAIRAPSPRPQPIPAMILRAAQLVPVNGVRISFGETQLQVAAVRLGAGGWKALGLDQAFGLAAPATTAVEWRTSERGPVPAVEWAPTHLGLDGRFDAQFPERGGDGWLWWLSGAISVVGVVLDTLEPRPPRVLSIALPPLSGTSSREGEDRPSPTATEVEIAQNPQIYSEDAGAFCKPFSNPERVLGERSFQVILRVEQPAISSEGTIRTKDLPMLDFDPPAVMATASAAVTRAVRLPERTSVLVQHELPKDYVDLITRFDRGRTELDAKHPIQWEGDITRYQAGTVARGHILEYRVRWRANGYSLGTVAKTLTLAPRQVKRIQKIEWERAERTRREERTQLVDRVADQVTRERAYEDDVRSNLAEWARGESSSSESAGAGGVGFAAAGFVIGGGGGGSHASSSSSQDGGRSVSASEEQRLRDEIRRYGDALRRFESVVVNEVTQQETVVGTTEVVRNPNYGHALTVIYHQILRHLRVETAFAGVRECLFVPFSVRPFTIDRAYRWRETVQRALRDPRYSLALTYLRDVVTGFANSDVPDGRRSDQPIRQLYGSLYLTLAIERPKNAADDKFDEAAWTPVRPFLGVPALAIYTRLQALAEARRDRVFQDEQAPRIAAGWVDTLELTAGGGPFKADFTLASRYTFNGTVRVDFTIEAEGITREMLRSIKVKATKSLPPGSVANLTKLSFTYQTDQSQRTVTAASGTNDLITVETGAVDPNGALVGAQPDAWERRNLRAEMTRAVQELVQHLNEHLEYYHKAIWWHMDRDRLFMLIDGYYVPRTGGVSIASVVERDPIAIVGNSIVFRVSAGSFLGLDDITTPGQLYNYYAGQQVPRDPMHVSLPTDGLYAQVVMDECPALEEHYGNTDWVLSDPDPELGTLSPELLASRRAEPVPATPTQLPQTIINLQNAPEAPAPTGLVGVLSAVTNANAFRDMAGLAGTQANAASALQTASNLASSFGAQAAALKLAELAAQAEATRTADQKVATVQKAKDKGLVGDQDAADHTNQILKQLHTPSTMPGLTPDQETLMDAFRATMGQPGSTIESTSPQGSLKLQLASLNQPLRQHCSFGVNGTVTEQEVRDAVVAATNDEVTNWRNFVQTGLLKENEDGQFGHLVRYWLARNAVIPPSVLLPVQDNATASSVTAPALYGQVLTLGDLPDNDSNLVAAAQAARAQILTGIPVITPANLAALVEDSIIRSHDGRWDDDNFGPWSAVFIVHCVRQAAITLNLEGERAGTHFGQDQLLLATQRHRDYVVEAHRRRFGPNTKDATYHAFRPGERTPQVGDIIIMDRTANSRARVWRFDRIPELDVPPDQKGRGLHADIIVEVTDDHVIAIGGNVDNSVRRAIYPLSDDGHLVVDWGTKYGYENDLLRLPALPVPADWPEEITSRTGRIFALLSPVAHCVVIPGQPVNGGVLT